MFLLRNLTLICKDSNYITEENPSHYSIFKISIIDFKTSYNCTVFCTILRKNNLLDLTQYNGTTVYLNSIVNAYG